VGKLFPYFLFFQKQFTEIFWQESEDILKNKNVNKIATNG